jgi:hypothetical protein
MDRSSARIKFEVVGLKGEGAAESYDRLAEYLNSRAQAKSGLSGVGTRYANPANVLLGRFGAEPWSATIIREGRCVDKFYRLERLGDKRTTNLPVMPEGINHAP